MFSISPLRFGSDPARQPLRVTDHDQSQEARAFETALDSARVTHRSIRENGYVVDFLRPRYRDDAAFNQVAQYFQRALERMPYETVDRYYNRVAGNPEALFDVLGDFHRDVVLDKGQRLLRERLPNVYWPAVVPTLRDDFEKASKTQLEADLKQVSGLRRRLRGLVKKRPRLGRLMARLGVKPLPELRPLPKELARRWVPTHKHTADEPLSIRPETTTVDRMDLPTRTLVYENGAGALRRPSAIRVTEDTYDERPQHAGWVVNTQVRDYPLSKTLVDAGLRRVRRLVGIVERAEVARPRAVGQLYATRRRALEKTV